MDLTDIYGILYPTTKEYTFFSAACGTFSKTNHILRDKASFNKHRKSEITYFILSDHNGLKIEINSKRNCRKYSNTWKLYNILLNVQWVIEEISVFMGGEELKTPKTK
jgi:adenylate cyclase class IV